MKEIVCKKIILILLILLSFQSYGQFKLSGKILHYKGSEKLQVNIPVVHGFYRENSINILISKDGSFSTTLPIQEQKFVNVIFLRKFHTLLFSPNSTLHITLNERDSTLQLISGASLRESRLMKDIQLEEYPFFMANDPNKTYANYTLKQLKREVIEPYFSQRDKKIQKVKSSMISPNNQRIISAELTYITYNYLSDFARTGISNRSLVDSLILEVYDQSDKNPQIFPAGPQYYSFIDNYIRYLETKAFFKVKPNDLGPNDLIPYFGVTIDSANKLIKDFGKPYWRWIGSIKNLEPNVAEQYNFQQLLTIYADKDLRQMTALTEAFKRSFPNSKYINDIALKQRLLEAKLAENSLNSNIKIIEGYEKITSIYEVIKGLKGKVVYLDVWGTWCGPCKAELEFIPDLKSKFKHKDVAYVYLDLDDDYLDSSWRDFIKVKNMEGLHLRKTRQTIAPFWKELLASTEDKAEYYPQYFIFDKDGKLVISKAKRPSNKEELYRQIEKFLN